VVYIVANRKNGTIYVGVTSNLVKRAYEHKNKLAKGFASKYGCTRLVYFELCNDIVVAISREKQLKAGSRAKKLALIEAMNPSWTDLYNGLLG
jgi:putative endonuclease